MKWKDWVHVTKLDPDKQLRPGDIDAIATSGTDALMLSGTLNVTKENLLCLQKQIAMYDLPLVMEPAGPEAVLLRRYRICLCAKRDEHHRRAVDCRQTRFWVQQQDGSIPWDVVVPEAYIVLNPDSSVGRVTKALCDLTPAEVAAYTAVADRYFHFPIVYIEYSGTYGDPAVLKAASEAVDCSILYYGGGINSAEKAAENGEVCRYDRGRKCGVRPGRCRSQSDGGRRPVTFFMPEIDIVLVAPLYEGNVGFAARVMKNFGFYRMVLVDPCTLGEEAKGRASHAQDVLKHAEICTIEDVFSRSSIVVATTGQVSKSVCTPMRMPFYSPRELRERIGTLEGRVSILFGRENWGLNNDEVKRSDMICHVPTAPDYPIMNLSHAVGIVCYELANLPPPEYGSLLPLNWDTCTGTLTVPGLRAPPAVQAREHDDHDPPYSREGPA